MSKISGAFRTGTGSDTLPAASLYAIAGVRLLLREVHVYNTTATSVVVALRRLTTAGTQGAGQTELEWDDDGPAPNGTLFTTHSGGPTITTGEIARAFLGAAIGAGVIWVFDDEPLRIQIGRASCRER